MSDRLRLIKRLTQKASKQMSITKDTNEPTTPTIGGFSRGREIERPDAFGNLYDIRVQGSTHEQDRKAYFADIEHRRNRATEFEAKRQQVKPKEIKVELSVLESAGDRCLAVAAVRRGGVQIKVNRLCEH